MDSSKIIMPTANYDSYRAIQFELIMGQLRQQVNDLILSRRNVNDENLFFDLGAFFRHRDIRKNEFKALTQEIVRDVEAAGWKYKLSYADTGLFIYSTPNPPPSAW